MKISQNKKTARSKTDVSSYNLPTFLALLRGLAPTQPLIFALVFETLLTATLASSSSQAGVSVNPGSLPALEVQARRVDRVALQSQDAAAARLRTLIKKYQGQAQEGVLLMRLAQIYQEGAGIEFRISYGRTPTQSTEKSLDSAGSSEPQLKKYRSRLTESIATINMLLQKFPRYPLVDEALFIRAKAKEELGLKDSAKEDYLTLTSHYKDSKHLIASYMALADIVIAKNNHLEAIQYLNQVEPHPESAFYPFALYKLAWSHFNLHNVPKALSYIERHVLLYFNKTPTHRFSSSDAALRENSLLDAAVFYFEGYEQNLPAYTLDSALSYFRKLQPGPYLGRMTFRFAKLLRSRLREKDLAAWKNELIQKEPQAPETMDVALTYFDHLWDQNRLEEVVTACRDIETLFQLSKNSVMNLGQGVTQPLSQSDSYLAARNALTNRAEKLQASILKKQAVSNGTTTGAPIQGDKSFGQFQLPMKVLKALYTSFINIVPETDPRILLAHYNLAETLFKISDFSSATHHYRWILQHWNKKIQFTRPEIELKAIAARYETLRAQNKIPTKITPARPDSLLWADYKSKLPMETLEWIEWIDSFSGKGDETLAGFEFEANRTVYQLGGVRAALERMVKFADRHKDSKFAVPSQELVLDSLLLTQNWPEIFRVTQRFLKRVPATSPFGIRLQQLAADSAFKQVEGHYQAKHYPELFDEAKNYVKAYPGNARVADALFLMANASLAQKDQKAALSEYSEVIEKHSTSPLAAKALLARAQLKLASSQWAEAAKDYEAYLASNSRSTPPSAEAQDIWKELFFLQWISGRTAASCTQLGEPVSAALKQECAKYSALSLLQNSNTNSALSASREQALKGPTENRAAWSMVALAQDARATKNSNENSKEDSKLELRDRLHLVRSLALNWDKLDATARLSTLNVLNTVLPVALEQARLEIKRATPMNRASAKAVSIRAEWIKEFEESVSKVMKLPWYRLQAASLLQLALAYDDFVVSLLNAPVPKDLTPEDVASYKKSVTDLVQPFSSKRDDIAERAIRIASEAAIETSARKLLEEKFPALAQKVEKEFQITFTKKFGQPLSDLVTQSKTAGPSIDLALLERILVQDPTAVAVSSAPSQRPDYKILWIESYHQKAWSKCAYLLQELTADRSLPDSQLKLMRAITLAAQGAQAEALLELHTALDGLRPETRASLTQVLLTQYYLAGSLENALTFAQLTARSVQQAAPKELAQDLTKKKGT